MKRRACLQWAGTAALLALAGKAQANAFEDFQVAIVRDNYVLMQQLLQRGMDPNTVDERGRPGLVNAMQMESLRVAQILVRAPGIRINLATPQGETALMHACIKGHLNWVRQLLAMDAKVNQPGWAPLHYAVSADLPDSVAIAALLLEQHAYIDAESPNKSTPLMLAAQYGSERMVQLLLDEGADPQLRNEQGLTAVDFAQRSEREFMVRLLQSAHRASRRTQPSW